MGSAGRKPTAITRLTAKGTKQQAAATNRDPRTTEPTAAEANYVSETPIADDNWLYETALVLGLGAVGPDIPPSPPPDRLALSNPWPNPLRDVSRLTVTVPITTGLTIDVVDASGRRVVVLKNKEAIPPGEQLITWNGRDQGGRFVPAGVYFVRASADGRHASRKVVRL